MEIKITTKYKIEFHVFDDDDYEQDDKPLTLEEALDLWRLLTLRHKERKFHIEGFPKIIQ